VENNFFVQCSTPLVGMRFCRHIPNSPKNKNKMSHNSCLLEKVVFLAFAVPLWYREKTLLSALNVVILQTVKNEYTRFGGHVDREISYKILQLEILNEAPILLNSPCVQ
jgi:hypothetical protein